MNMEENSLEYFEFLKDHIQTQLRNDEVSSWVIEQELNLLEEFANQIHA